MTLKAPATMPTNDRDFQRWCLETYDLRLRFGTGSPAGVVVADRGTVWMRIDGGASTTMYIKEGGDGTSSNWRAV